ncbi:MAG: ECF transporter S component [Firmicutes bacterium]|nr:ECF transporter S component [Bacillota bacterium]
MKKQRFLQAFSAYDLILIAMLTALAVAFKVVVKMLIGLIATPLGIPGGALAGGFYMLWIPLTVAIVGKRGSAFLMTFVQCLVIIITAMPGSHGIWTFATYLPPAILAEVVMLRRTQAKPARDERRETRDEIRNDNNIITNDDLRLTNDRGINEDFANQNSPPLVSRLSSLVSNPSQYTVLHFIFACILANLAGTFGSNLLFFRLGFVPLFFAMSAGAFSGAMGGVLGYLVYKLVAKSGIFTAHATQYKNYNEESPSEFCAPKGETPWEEMSQRTAHEDMKTLRL